MAYQTIVVGTDGSPTAELATQHAGALAAALGARLVVVTAFTPQPAATARARDEAPDELRWMITDANAAEQRARRGAELARAEGAERVDVRAEPGEAAHVVLSVAEDEGADVVVVGSKGMTSAARFFLGNVPNKVSHHAPCDLVIVRTAA